MQTNPSQHNANFKSKVWLNTIILSAVIPILIGYLLNFWFTNQQWIHIPLHSLIEGIGGFSAIVLALFILTTRRNESVSANYIWVATAFIGMGILDIFHASILPGNNFIWLRSLATFIGGITFALIALPDSIYNKSFVKYAPASMAVFALLIGALTILNPGLVPLMTAGDQFSLTAKALNTIGGLGFLIAWLLLASKASNQNNKENSLLANHTLLFGVAALLFTFSAIWDSTWWFWHFLRLLAYLIVLIFFMKIYLNNVKRIKKNEQHLRENTKKLSHERALINSIIENSSSLISLKDLDGKYLLCNSNFSKFFDHSPQHVIGKKINQILDSKAVENEHKQDQKVIDSKRRFEEEITYSLDNEEFTFIASRFPLVNHLGDVYAVGLVLTDISIRKQMEKNLELAKNIIDHTNEGVIVTDQYHRIKEVNSAFSEISGYSSHEVMQSLPPYCQNIENVKTRFENIKLKLETTGFWSGEVWAKKKNGENYPLWISVTAIYDENNEISNYVSIFHDISHSKKIEAQLEKLAYYDPLKNLPNRTLFKERLKHDIASSQRHEEKLALMLFDLDEFKLVNDSMGHDIGDEVLKESAKRIQACIRESDTPARLGGDEFTVILLNLHKSEAANQVANKILKVLKQPFYIKHFTISLSASIGISVYPYDGQSVATLVKNADLALYKAKAAGGNTFHHFSSELQEIANENMQLKNEILDAIKSSEFEVYYQAKVDSLRQQVVGMEALVRWNHPSKGLIAPFKFIPHAELSGSIIEIGEIVLIQSCLDAKQLQDQFATDLVLSVNLSTKQFKDQHLLDKIQYALKLSGLAPQCLELEITESSVMDDVDDALKTLIAIHELGIKIAIDDFGTGYSSLAYLKQFPIDTIKIDKSFVQEIETDSDDRAIIESIILLSEKLRVDVIAEGVETKEQLCFLQENNCHTIQGFLFHKPAKKSEFEYYLQQQINNKETL